MAKQKAPPSNIPTGPISRAIDGGAKLSISVGKRFGGDVQPLAKEWRVDPKEFDHMRPGAEKTPLAPPPPDTEQAARKPRPRVSQAPPPVPTVGGRGVVWPSEGARRVVTVSKTITLIHVKALIAAFQEAEGYDPHLHHNQPAPALWSNDEEYLRNIKELVQELRRFNQLLEAKQENSAAVAKSGGLIAKMAEKACLSAAAIMGAGVGGLAVASLYAVISYTDAGAEVLQRLPLLGKGK